jgi:hypothetical protein
LALKKTWLLPSLRIWHKQSRGICRPEGTVEGWYRRSLAPYIEMSKLTREIGPDGKPKTSRLYSRWIQSLAAAVCFSIGWLWLTGAL